LLGNTEEIGDLVLGHVLVVVENEGGALAYRELEQCLGDYFPLLDIGGATLCTGRARSRSANSFSKPLRLKCWRVRFMIVALR
jgi:hypothetical protein